MSPLGKTWYINSTTCMYNPSKARKYVSFDSSAHFEGGSIHQELLSVPDLTNQVVGLLTGFQ